jgi:hypothetical protein
MIKKLERKFDVATFSKKIEEMVRFEGMTYVEALVAFAEANGMEVEAVAALVRRSDPIKQKLEAFCRNSNLLVKDGPAGATLEGFLTETG